MGGEGRWQLADEDVRRLLKESKRYKGESLASDAWRRLRKSRASFWSLVFLALFALTSFLAPLLPMPSPKALTLETEPVPPDWPWGGARVYEDAGWEPGTRPTIEHGAFVNNGWRHRATARFTVPGEGALEGDDLAALVGEAAGRSAALESRALPAGGFEHYVTVPLVRDDAPRVDYSPTGREGTLAVWRQERPDGSFEVHYDLNIEPRGDAALEDLERWSVEQRTRRGKLYVVPRERPDGVYGYRYDFTLEHHVAGSPRSLTVNGARHPLDSADPSPADPADRGEASAAGRKLDLAVALAREQVGRAHADLGQRLAAALESSDTSGTRFEGLAIENGYWELGALDRAMVHLRGRLFGLWQTGNWLGTDAKGQDILSRIVWGSRTSILVALAATLCSLLIGVTYGAFSGLVGGRVDNVMMRVVDILYSIPFIFVVIFLITVVNTYRTELEDVYGIDREVIFFVVIGAIYWLTMARVVRGQVLALKNTEFIEAARVIGASMPRILFAHLVPNVLSIVIVYLTLTIPSIMLFEAFLSYLGLGIEAPKVSWGLLAVDGLEAVNRMHVYWWLVVFPALAMGTTLLALNILGDGLRDALDPKLRGKD